MLKIPKKQKTTPQTPQKIQILNCVCVGVWVCRYVSVGVCMCVSVCADVC